MWVPSISDSYWFQLPAMNNGITPTFFSAVREMIKDIVNGFLITSLIFLISVFIPIVGFVAALFLPLPILFYRLKLGRKPGAIIFAGAGLVMIALVGGISLDVLFFAELLLIGFVLGELIELNLSIEKTVLFACGSALLAGLAGLLISSVLSGEGIYTIVSRYVGKNLELTMVLYRNMGMPEESIELISRSLEKIRHVLVSIVPALCLNPVYHLDQYSSCKAGAAKPVAFLSGFWPIERLEGS
jgi:hypothetical protein